MARTDAQFNLRMPPNIKEFIEVSAKHNGRSINAEIVYRLQKLIDEEKGMSSQQDMTSTEHQLINSQPQKNLEDNDKKILEELEKLLKKYPRH